MTIPCFIIMRNLVTWPLAMVPHIERMGLTPVFWDQESTYGPLLEFYSQSKYEIHRRENLHSDGVFGRVLRLTDGWFVITDPDLDISGVPSDFLLVAQDMFGRETWARKVGLSLETDNIPINSLSRDKIANREHDRWKADLHGGHSTANIGSTFALYHTTMRYGNYYRAVRLARPYTARHLPWYFTKNEDIDDEYMYYLETLDASAVYSAHLRKQLRQ